MNKNITTSAWKFEELALSSSLHHFHLFAGAIAESHTARKFDFSSDLAVLERCQVDGTSCHPLQLPAVAICLFYETAESLHVLKDFWHM